MPVIIFLDERHGAQMDGATRGHLHQCFGAKWVSGLALTGMSVDGDGSLDAHAQFGVQDGLGRDEDLTVAIVDGVPQTLRPVLAVPVLYRFTAGGDDWQTPALPADAFPIRIPGQQVQWNEETAPGVWQATDLTNGQFTFMHYFGINAIPPNPGAPAFRADRVIAIMGQQVFNDLDDAREAAETALNHLKVDKLPVDEFIPLATVIIEYNSAFTNAADARLRSTEDGSDYVDHREQFFGAGGEATDPSDCCTELLLKTPLHLYVDPVVGSDASVTGNMANPLATLAEVERRVALNISTGAVVLVSMKPGTYTWPQWRPRTLGAPIIHYADEAWDPTVFTVLTSGTADAGSSDSVLVDAGPFVVDAYRRKSVRILTGAAAGDVRKVRNNTGTTIVPDSKFSAAVAAGDAYEVFESNVDVSLDGVPAGDTEIALCAGLGNDVVKGIKSEPGVFVFAGLNFTTAVPNTRRTGITGSAVFYGCTMEANNFDVANGSTCYFGCDGVENPANAIKAKIPEALLGAVSDTAWRGWGMSFEDSARLGPTGGPIVGYFSAATIVGPAIHAFGQIEWVGGGCPDNGLSVLRYGTQWDIGGRTDSTGVLIDGSVNGVIVANVGAQMSLDRVQVSPTGGNTGLRVAGGAMVRVTPNTTGESPAGLSIDASRGGHVYSAGALALGRAVGNDIDAGNGFPQNKSFFAASGDHIAHTDGSVVQRV